MINCWFEYICEYTWYQYRLLSYFITGVGNHLEGGGESEWTWRKRENDVDVCYISNEL